MLKTLNVKQAQLWALLHTHKYVLAYGGARAGKTWLILLWLVAKALKTPNIRQLVARRYATDVRASIWKQTLPEILSDVLELSSVSDYHKQDVEMELRFQNGSRLICTGLDDKERVDKILGQDFSTIYLNEVSDIPWSTVRILRTRLSQKVKEKIATPYNAHQMISDLNPTSLAHWSYCVFFKKKDPESGLELTSQEKYACLKIDTQDNAVHLPEGYIDEELATLSGMKRARFFLGEYSATNDLQVFRPHGYVWAEFVEWVGHRWPDVRLVGGVDIGFEDADAIAVIAYIPGDAQVWLVFEHKMRRASITDLANAVRRAETWCRENIPNGGQSIVFFGDTGGGGKKIIWELRVLQGIPIRAAYKHEKKMAVELLQDAVNGGKLKVPSHGTFFEESEQIVFTRAENGDILRVIDDTAYHPDMMDAILYGMRYLWVTQGVEKGGDRE